MLEVLTATSANQNLVNVGHTTSDSDWNGKASDRLFMIHPFSIDEDFLETLNMELIAGRRFFALLPILPI